MAAVEVFGKPEVWGGDEAKQSRQVLGCASAGTAGPIHRSLWVLEGALPCHCSFLDPVYQLSPESTLEVHLGPFPTPTSSDSRGRMPPAEGEGGMGDLVSQLKLCSYHRVLRPAWGVGDKRQAVLFMLFLLSQEAQCGLKLLPWSPCLKMTSAS